MNILKRFGSGSQLYTFPTDSQVSYTDNFASLVTKTIRLPGVNGGFSNLGTGPGLSPIGTVRADIWLDFGDYVEATDKVASLRAMASYGLMPLVRQPLYGAEQFCFARLNDAQLQQAVQNVPHRRLKVPLVFEVPDPFWYRPVRGFGKLWDDGVTLWDDGSSWDADTGYVVSNIATWPFTNPGNTFTLPRLFLINSSGSSVTHIRIRRMVNGVAVDDCQYTTALATGTYLDVDPARRRVSIGPVGTNALSYFTANSPDWLRLMPGSNSLKITCTGALTLYMQYLERNI